MMGCLNCKEPTEIGHMYCPECGESIKDEVRKGQEDWVLKEEIMRDPNDGGPENPDEEKKVSGEQVEDDNKKEPKDDVKNPKKSRSRTHAKPEMDIEIPGQRKFEFQQGRDVFMVVHFAGAETTKHNLVISGLNPWQMALIATDLNERAKIGIRKNIVQQGGGGRKRVPISMEDLDRLKQ